MFFWKIVFCTSENNYIRIGYQVDLLEAQETLHTAFALSDYALFQVLVVHGLGQESVDRLQRRRVLAVQVR